jgi:SAM-dependent methyltransferase
MNHRDYYIPLDWFVCPVLKQPLKLSGSFLVSSAGSYEKNKKYGFWDFTPKQLSDLKTPEWKTWRILQDNSVVSYKADPKNNLGVGKREDFGEFSTFCNFKGIVLDVGVGPQKSPTHIRYCSENDVQFVGIDPIVGIQPRSFAFVQGLGEYLPFRNDLFDQVIFVTTLDHFINPRIALLEAKRVLKPKGNICVWTGEKDRDAPKPSRSHEWYEKLTTPEGAEDPFHFKRLDAQLFEAYAADAELSLEDHIVMPVDKWRRNLFYRLAKKC